MSEPDPIGDFLDDLARMDDATVSLLDAYFHARDTARRKLERLGELAVPGRGDGAASWAAWHETVPGRRQPETVRYVAGLIRQELRGREERAERAERARRATLTAREAGVLPDAELAALRMALGALLETPRSRWRLLAALGGLWEGGPGPPDWRRWGCIAEGPETALAAATSAVEAEARRRGLGDAAGGPGRGE
jgi:hypothetical protein